VKFLYIFYIIHIILTVCILLFHIRPATRLATCWERI